MSGARTATLAFVGLGSNVGDRLAHLQSAVDALSVAGETRVEAASAVYETEAHVLAGQGRQPDHLNAVVQIATRMAPGALLEVLQQAERAAGRAAAAPRWSPRPLDADLLLYGDAVVEAPGLTVPHPHLALRRFVLAPLADVAPHVVVPGLGQTVAGLLDACPDRARIERTDLRLVAPR